MKRTFLLLTLACCPVLPALVHADTPTAKSKPAKHDAAAAQPAPAKQHETSYIMKSPATGSHIPMVWRQYDGRIDSASSSAVYGQTQLNRTGALDVSSELYMLDPSISIGHRH